MKKSLFTPRDVTSLAVGDRIHVYGSFMAVVKLHRVYIKRSEAPPIELVELWVEGIPTPLRVPAGWQVKVSKVMPEATSGVSPVLEFPGSGGVS